MHPDSGRKLVIGLVIVAVAAILVGVLISWLANRPPSAPKDVFRPGNPKALPTVQGGTREVIQRKIATPELGATSTPKGVAVPTNVSQLSGPGGEAALRDFEIKADKGKFSPDTIVVNDGDVVTIHLTAVDADYNIYFPDFGMYLPVKKGETRKSQGQFTGVGQYQFFCKDCNNEAKGTLIVNEKPQ